MKQTVVHQTTVNLNFIDELEETLWQPCQGRKLSLVDNVYKKGPYAMQLSLILHSDIYRKAEKFKNWRMLRYHSQNVTIWINYQRQTFIFLPYLLIRTGDLLGFEGRSLALKSSTEPLKLKVQNLLAELIVRMPLLLHHYTSPLE